GHEPRPAAARGHQKLIVDAKRPEVYHRPARIGGEHLPSGAYFVLPSRAKMQDARARDEHEGDEERHEVPTGVKLVAEPARVFERHDGETDEHQVGGAHSRHGTATRVNVRPERELPEPREQKDEPE